MDYYTYKCSVLQHLMELLDIKSVNIIDNNYQALTTIRNDNGKLEFPVKTIKLESIVRLDFINNFHFAFDEKLLNDAYKGGYLPSRTAEVLKRKIVNEYVKGILKNE